MSEIVLVHGIAQEQYSADLLESRWLPALAGGVRTAGFPEVADRIWRARGGPGGSEARMAFYGHLFLRPGAQGIEPDELSPEQAALAEGLAVEWLERAATRASSDLERRTAEYELVDLRPGPGGQAQGVGSVVRGVWRRAASLPWFARAGMAAATFVLRALAQVTRYLTEDDLRAEAQQLVLDRIGPQTKVLLGHSLGSVVAYEVARELERPLPLLITLGSPLGLDTIVYPRLRPQPPSFPRPVRHWVNVADRDDLVAAEPDLTALFSATKPPDAMFEGGFTVENGAEPHSALFYLGKVEVGRPVGQVLLTGVR
jgi:hypothetical protein